jgi:hypothetical protein
MSGSFQSAKSNRDRLFAERATILQEEEKRSIAVRQNMARLRELRLAKEAQETTAEISTVQKPAKTKSRKR